jgi:hypothetical protein
VGLMAADPDRLAFERLCAMLDRNLSMYDAA